MSKKLNRKHRCCECGKIEVWYNEFGTKNRTKYYCEDCVPRGSISNVDNIEDIGEPNPNKKIMWWSEHCLHNDLLKNGSLERDKDSFYYEELDEEGRRSPSDDFSYSERGFDKKDDEKSYVICYDDILESIDDCNKSISLDDEFEISDALGEIFLEYRNLRDLYSIDYNLFMSKVGDFFHSRFNGFDKNKYESWKKFYINFKQVISNCKCKV